MIFATVGTQLPFPRLIDALDQIAGTKKIALVAQTADPSCHPTNLKAYPHLSPAEYDRLFHSAELIIAHAGIGSVLSAQKHRKPIILFPRLASMGEHRNDHQLATVRQLSHMEGVYVCHGIEDLSRMLDRKGQLVAAKVDVERRNAFAARLKNYIDGHLAREDHL